MLNYFSFNQNSCPQLLSNYQILKEAVQDVGRTFHQQSYENLLSNSENLTRTQNVCGHLLSFHPEIYSLLKDGTLCIGIKVFGLPTLFGITPIYYFYKHPDQSVSVSDIRQFS